MAFIAVYDANVLYPSTLRDLLIRIAQLARKMLERAVTAGVGSTR
jgi:hypothetical protein